MLTELENIDLFILRQGIDVVIARAMYFHDKCVDATVIKTFHLQEKYAKLAIAHYHAAHEIMMSHGPLFDEYINHDDWVRLRALKRKYY